MKPSKKDLINFQSIDHNECLKLWLIICLHLSNHHPARTRKVDKGFSTELDLNTKFSIKITDIHKTEKKNCISISVFGYENREKYPIYVSKYTFKGHIVFTTERRRK